MKIVQYPDPFLRKKNQKVKEFNKNLQQIVKTMKEVMVKNNGLGLAANQIGLDLALFIARPKNKFYVFINPEIIKFNKKTLMEEGCLSIKNTWGIVERYEEIVVKFQDLKGKTKKLKAKGLLAQIIQHEIDHLNGVLFIDKVKEKYTLKNE